MSETPPVTVAVLLGSRAEALGLRLGVLGGAVYDGLVALSAAAHGATLLTLDRRALPTYRRCGVPHRLLPTSE